VTPETWIVFDAPSSIVANVQLRVPDEIEHPVTAGSIDHATPGGNGSLSVTLLAVPGPLFVTTIVNAAVSPALIVPWSAVLVTEMLGCTTAMALGWMLRSWFLFELLSSCWVRMCHGAPLIVAAPLAAPPLDSFQYADCAMCAPHRKKAQSLVVVNVNVMSPLPDACAGAVMLLTVPPYIVRFRLTPAKAIAPLTVSPGLTAGVKESPGNAWMSAEPRLLGHCEDAPPELGSAHLFGLWVTVQVARKSYGSRPPCRKTELR